MEFRTRHVIILLDATGVFSFVTGRFRCRPQNAKCEAALHNKICFTIVPRFESRHARAVIRVTYVWSELHIYSQVVPHCCSFNYSSTKYRQPKWNLHYTFQEHNAFYNRCPISDKELIFSEKCGVEALQRLLENKCCFVFLAFISPVCLLMAVQFCCSLKCLHKRYSHVYRQLKVR